MAESYNQIQKMPNYKMKNLKFSVSEIRQQNQQKPSIKVLFEDNYFLKNVDPDKIIFPQNIRQNYNIEFGQKQITLELMAGKMYDLSKDSQNINTIRDALSGIIVYHVGYTSINQQVQQLRRKINTLNNHGILGFKKFHVKDGRFEQGDFLFYSKGSIKQFMSIISQYMEKVQLQFGLDWYFKMRQVPQKHFKKVTDIIIGENIKQMAERSKNELDILITEMASILNPKDFRDRWPISSIQLIVSGNRNRIHQLYEIIQAIITNFYVQVIELQEDDFISERIDCLPDIFPEYTGKIYKISSTSVAILDSRIDSESIKRKLKLNKWIIGQQEFSQQEIRTLHSQYRNRSLKSYMNEKRVYWDSLNFTLFQIQLTCEKQFKDRFVEQCKNLLKTFVKQRQICRNFDNNFYIEVFKKYYQNLFQQKFSVQFQIGDKYLIRKNYTKYSQQIQQQLKLTRQNIRKKLITFVSLFPIKNNMNVNTKLFQQVPNPSGYAYEYLGCRLYKMGNIKIKMRPFQSLKRQQQCITYLIDNRLDDQSKFYEIIKRNSINYTSFLTDANKPKRPDRLRQYITEDCPYAHRTVLLHAGREKVTNTLRRDVEGLFSLIQQRVCITLFKHGGDFLEDVFLIFLDEISILVASTCHKQIQNNIISLSMINQSQQRSQFEVDIYYEGGVASLQQIQNAMRKSNLKIEKITSFSLQQMDIEKIYALQYNTMCITKNNTTSCLSPIIAELCHLEVKAPNRSIKDNSKRRFIFSAYSEIKHQLVEFICSSRSGICYKVTHDVGKHSWSKLPRIQKIQQRDHELQQILKTIHKYFKIPDFTVISAQVISDGIHGRTMVYCKQFYFVKGDSDLMYPVSIDLTYGKIHERDNYNKHIKWEINNNNLKEWYEITTYKEQIQTINSYL